MDRNRPHPGTIEDLADRTHPRREPPTTPPPTVTIAASLRALRFGLRARILLLVLLIGGVVAAFFLVGSLRQADRDRDQARERLRLVAALAGARLDDHIGDIHQFLKTLAETLPDDLSDIRRNEQTLLRLAPKLPANTRGIGLWSPGGDDIGSSSRGDVVSRPRVTDFAFFADALRSPAVVTQAPLRLTRDDEWIGMFATRVVRDGKVVAIVSVSTRLETLDRVLEPDGTLPQGAVIAVADADATVVARSIDPQRWIGQPAPIDRRIVKARLALGSGDAMSTGLDGTTRLYGFARSRQLPWLIHVGVPSDVALAAAYANRREGLLLGGVTLLIVALLAVWLANRITRPLRQLSADARRIAGGKLDHRSAVRSGSEVGLLAVTLNDMTAALQDRINATRRQEERLMLALEGSDQALFDWDVPGGRIHYSARASALRGGPEAEADVTPAAMRELVHADDLPGVLAAMRDALRGTVPLYEAEFRVLHRDGNWVWLRSRGRVVERDASGRALRLVGTDADISRRKAVETELRQRAERDVLTGLPNRALFFDRLDGAVARARRSGKPMALLYLDVDRFKSINDLHGHAAGDALLQTTAERLVATVRGTDTVARLSGDEFTVILENLVDRLDAAAVAEKLVEAMRSPVVVGTGTVSVSTSVGIAVLEPGDADGAALLRRADDALYDAKRNGRDRYAVSRAVAG